MAASSCSPMRVGKHLGRSEQADQMEKMTTICIFTAQDFQIAGLRVIPKASVENEKEGSMELPLEGSEGLQ